MSELLRALLEIEGNAKIKRLKIGTWTAPALAGGTVANPVLFTARYNYKGTGVFMPHAFFPRGILPASWASLTPRPATFTVSVRDKNNKIILDRDSLNYGNADTIISLHNYFDNFDHGTAIASDEWWDFNISVMQAAAVIVSGVIVGTEYLF